MTPRLDPHRGARRRAERGITLLEVMLATALFALAAGFSLEITSNAADNTLAANNQRVLRMLAERKLGEILTFEEYALDSFFEGDFGKDYEEFEGLYDGWEWKFDLEDRNLFPPATEQQGEPLLPDPEGEGDDEIDTSEDPDANQPRTNNQELTEIRLTVTSPSVDGDGDSVYVVLLLPRESAAAPAPGAGPNPNPNPGGPGSGR